MSFFSRLMSFFSRFFKIGQAHANSVVDMLEDPIKMTEQGIRDLKADLQDALTGLAEVRAIAIRTGKNAEREKLKSSNYERKAMFLLQKMQNGALAKNEAERLATLALNKKEEHTKLAVRWTHEAEQQNKMADNLKANVSKLRSSISRYEKELVTLKARAKTSAATKKINRRLASIDSSGTIDMLEKMKSRVEEEESLALAYMEIGDTQQNIDDEINAALEQGRTVTDSAGIIELKEKMGILT